jgi:hypothetical protein
MKRVTYFLPWLTVSPSKRLQFCEPYSLSFCSDWTSFKNQRPTRGIWRVQRYLYRLGIVHLLSSLSLIVVFFQVYGWTARQLHFGYRER